MRQGDLAFVKSTEEPTVVLSTVGEEGGIKVHVRRPLVTTEGTQYIEATFFRFELETVEEKDLRLVEDLKRRHLMSQRASKEVGADQSNLFAPVGPGDLRN